MLSRKSIAVQGLRFGRLMMALQGFAQFRRAGGFSYPVLLRRRMRM